MRNGNVERRVTFDAELQLKDAGLVAASAAATVGGAAKVVNIGSGNWMGVVVVDATAVETDTGDEKFSVAVQLSSTADFSSDIVEVAVLPLGAAAALSGDKDLGVGRYTIDVCNNQGGSTYSYMRVYTHVAGTVATGIDYIAYASVG